MPAKSRQTECLGAQDHMTILLGCQERSTGPRNRETFKFTVEADGSQKPTADSSAYNLSTLSCKLQSFQLRKGLHMYSVHPKVSTAHSNHVKMFSRIPQPCTLQHSKTLNLNAAHALKLKSLNRSVEAFSFLRALFGVFENSGYLILGPL